MPPFLSASSMSNLTPSKPSPSAGRPRLRCPGRSTFERVLAKVDVSGKRVLADALPESRIRGIRPSGLEGWAGLTAWSLLLSLRRRCRAGATAQRPAGMAWKGIGLPGPTWSSPVSGALVLSGGEVAVWLNLSPC
jgi:hypothetical protein